MEMRQVKPEAAPGAEQSLLTAAVWSIQVFKDDGKKDS